MGLIALANAVRSCPGLAAKRDVGVVGSVLGRIGAELGDDCAAIPDGDGHLLFAIEGFIPAFVARDPWFAGWCGLMVNLSDIAAMGGRALAVVDALWADGAVQATPVLEGMQAASAAYGIPVAGGHSNLRNAEPQLAVAVLGRARALLSSFAAQPGELLIAAVDLRGRYRPVFDNWEAALETPAERLRGDLELLPLIAEAGLSRAAKDISQAGLVGTAVMLSECSAVGLRIDPDKIPAPDGVALERWLRSFPSFGFLLTAAPGDTPEILARFQARGIAAAVIGGVETHRQVLLDDGESVESIWDFTAETLMACGPVKGAAA